MHISFYRKIITQYYNTAGEYNHLSRYDINSKTEFFESKQQPSILNQKI